MKLLSSKRAFNTVLISLALLSTLNVSAKDVSLTQALTDAVHAQGKVVQHDLSAQLSQSIKTELTKFSMRYNAVKSQHIAAVSTPKNTTKQQRSKKY